MSQHPLRPKEGRILVCEGEVDHLILSRIFSKFPIANSIMVYYAGGEDNVRKLASILNPSVYIADRDFKLSSHDAYQTLTNKKRQTYWRYLDIESYLIHADWLMNFAEQAHQSPNLRIQNKPSNETEIQQQIYDIAHNMIPDHAGRRTIEIVTAHLPPQYDYKPRVNKDYVVGGAKASDYDDWKKLLEAEKIRLHSLGKNLEKESDLNDILTTFDEQVELYHHFYQTQSQFNTNFLENVFCKP